MFINFAVQPNRLLMFKSYFAKHLFFLGLAGCDEINDIQNEFMLIVVGQTIKFYFIEKNTLSGIKRNKIKVLHTISRNV